MKRRWPIIPFATLTLGLATTALAGVACIQLSQPAEATTFAAFPLASTYVAQARNLADTQPAAARAAALDALAVKPTEPEAWLRLAALEAPGGSLSPKALQALSRSYSVAPYQPGLIAVRTCFAHEYWDQIPPDLQHQVLSEMRASWEVPLLRQRMLGASSTCATSLGRLRLASALFNLRLEAVAAQAKPRDLFRSLRPKPASPRSPQVGQP